MPGLGLRLTDIAARRPGNSSLAAAPHLFLNGSANAAFRAAVARVRSGTGRGKLLFKGDSTTVGQGGGTGAAHLIGARANRVPAVLAAALSTAGVPALDVGIVADNGVINGGLRLDDYDARVTTNTWTRAFDHSFAGGGYLIVPDSGGEQLRVGFPGTTDTLEVVHYSTANAPYNVSLDGVTITAGNSGATQGFGRTMQTVARGAGHTALLNTAAPANNLAICSVRAWDSGTPALDIVVDAACGATAAQQGSATTPYAAGWSNLAHLRFEAPDLTIVNLGINDDLQGVDPDATMAALGAIVAAARESGDVLLVAPHGFDTARVPDTVQAARNAATRQLAARNGVACLSLYDAFGPFAATAPMLVDGLHPTADFYARIAALHHAALGAMIAG